jgi:heterodisulfide reductase subunit B
MQPMRPEMETTIRPRSWHNYRNNVPDDHFYYARSCIRQTFFPGSESAFLSILRNELGKDVMDDARHTSCNGIGYHSDIVPLPTVMTVVARQFALMTETGYRNLLASCVTSFGLYNEILHMWEHHPETLEKTREYLWKATRREFIIPESIVHTSDVIHKFRNEIFNRSKFSLVHKNNQLPLRMAEHVGCHYAKIFPDKGVGGAEFPKVLSDMIESWGGEVVDYPERRHCCGFGFRQYLVRENRGYSVANTRKKLESLAPYRPDMILTNCPGCAMFMDKWQYTIGEMEGRTFGSDGRGIPVLTYEELAGLVLGYDPWDLGLQMHQVDVEPLLKKIGVEYSPSRKYLNAEGKYLGKPVVPNYCSL